MRKNRIRLRNHIVHHLNNWQQLGCYVRAGVSPRLTQKNKNKGTYEPRFVSGVAKDGRAILIYPITSKFAHVPAPVVALMMEYDSRGAIVGTAENESDAFDIVVCNEKEYPRKQKTWGHRYWLDKQKRKTNDAEE